MFKYQARSGLLHSSDVGCIPAEFIRNYEDFKPRSGQLPLTNEEFEILRKLHKASEDGYEYGVVIVDGVVSDMFTSSERDAVKIPNALLIQMSNAPTKSVHLLHCHTNSTPHSAMDFKWLLRREIARVTVIACTGDVYTVEVGDDGDVPCHTEFVNVTHSKAIEAEVAVTNLQGFENWTKNERDYVAIREKTYLIARHYKWTLEGGYLYE